jgi:hypothetical protein
VDPLIVFEKDVTVEVLPPKLCIHPAETVGDEKLLLTVGADIYEPDVATITVRADPDVIRVKPPNFELSEKNPEAIVEVSVGRVGFFKKLFRQKVVSSLYFTDANGILMPTTATVDLRPSAPLWVYFGLGSFPFACILIPVVIGKRRRRRRLKKGKERVFAEKRLSVGAKTAIWCSPESRISENTTAPSRQKATFFSSRMRRGLGLM